MFMREHITGELQCPRFWKLTIDEEPGCPIGSGRFRNAEPETAERGRPESGVFKKFNQKRIIIHFGDSGMVQPIRCRRDTRDAEGSGTPI